MSGGRSKLAWAYAVTPSVEGEGKGNSWNSHVAGGADFTNEVVLDGTSAVIQIGGQVGESSPPMEAVDEFKVQTSGIPAEYGRTAGGVFNFSLKSGTNQIRGKRRRRPAQRGPQRQHLAEQLPEGDRPENAKRTTARRTGSTSGSLSLGGPIIKDKTFFYVAVEDYQQSRFVLGGFTQTVPIARVPGRRLQRAAQHRRRAARHRPRGQPDLPRGDPGPAARGTSSPATSSPRNRISSDVAADRRHLPAGLRAPGGPAQREQRPPLLQRPRSSSSASSRQADAPLLDEEPAERLVHLDGQRPRTLVDSGGIWDPSDPNQMGGPLSRGRTQDRGLPAGAVEPQLHVLLERDERRELLLEPVLQPEHRRCRGRRLAPEAGLRRAPAAATSRRSTSATR